MSGKKSSKFGRLRSVLASFLVLIGILVSANGMIVQENAYAIGEDDETSEVITEEEIDSCMLRITTKDLGVTAKLK